MLKLLPSFGANVGHDQPRLYYNTKGKAQKWVGDIRQLTQRYRPTPWLFNTHLQLLFFDLVKKKTIRFRYDHTDTLTMSDGGTTALAWAGYGLPETVPTVVVLHTISGSPASMAELVRDLRRHTGWRVVVCVRRGHDGLPLAVPRVNLLGCTTDLREQLAEIRRRFPESPLYAVGSSAGSGLLVRYLGEEGAEAPFKAAFAFCPGYNTDVTFSLTHPLYSRLMARKLLKTFVAPNLAQLGHLNNLQQLLASRDLSELHEAMYEFSGYASYQDYSRSTNPMVVFENIVTPLMILNAEDDPVCRIENASPYLQAIERSPNMLLVTTTKGSHCAYYEGWGATSWAGRLMANYFFAVERQAVDDVRRR